MQIVNDTIWILKEKSVLNRSKPTAIFIEKFVRKSEFLVYMFDLMNKCLVSNLTKGRLSYHLFVECFSQLSFDSEVYTKSAAVLKHP